jgi:hypothetical protein
MPEIFPKKFIVDYVFFGRSNASNTLELIDNKLVLCIEYGVFDTKICKKEIIPNKKEWIQFWSEMDKIGIWNWKKEYTFDSTEILADEDISKIKIDLEDKNLDTFCWCNAPEGLGEFFDALKKLIKIDIRNPNALN